MGQLSQGQQLFKKLGATLSAKAATPNSRICPIMVAKVQRESGRCAIQRHAEIVPATTAPASHENLFAPFPKISSARPGRSSKIGRPNTDNNKNDQMTGSPAWCNVVNLTPIENSCRKPFHSVRLRDLPPIRRKGKTTIIKPYSAAVARKACDASPNAKMGPTIRGPANRAACALIDIKVTAFAICGFETRVVVSDMRTGC